MKIQNNKTKTMTTVITALVIGLALLSPTTVLPNINAISIGNTQKPADVIYIEQHLPKPLTASELTTFKQLSLSNKNVQKIINGGSYAFMGQDFVGDLKKGTLYPEIHINVGDRTEITVVADLAHKTVISVTTGPIIKRQPFHFGSVVNGKDPSFAVDYYTGSATIDGLYDEKAAPTINTSYSQPQVAWLLNALETGANTSLACTNGDQFANYFAQVGFQYYSQAQPTWDDTTTNCVGQNVNLTYTGGDTYFFEIYVNSSSQWTMLGEDLNTSKYFTRAFPIAVQYDTFATSNPNTGVFFEDHDTSTTWAPYFTSTPSATDANYDLSSDSGWNAWDNDAQVLQDCSGNIVTNNVMTGQLKNSGTTDWNMTAMEAYHC